MESLVATYASSSDDEEKGQDRDRDPRSDRQNPRNPTPVPESAPPPPPKSFLSSLPPPKSSLPKPSSAERESCSLSSKLRALPPPGSKPSSSIFGSLPLPMPAPSDRPAKKVVQFRPPVDPSLFNSSDEEEDGDVVTKKAREKKPVKDPGVGRIASALPPPRHSFSLAPSGRRTVLEALMPADVRSGGDIGEEKTSEVQDHGLDGGEYGGYYGDWGGEVEGQSNSVENGGVCGDVAGWIPTDASYNQNYGDYGGYYEYGAMEATAMLPAAPAVEPDIGRILGKRGRDEIPEEILEIKQEELVKNRPREDLMKATGIAFGPAYQPAPSAKGKPSKLHKRKHQIGSLYFEMKQNESTLAERRAKGMLTKKETQGKYGW